MVVILVYAIGWFARILTFALFAEAILSWFAQDPYSGLGKAYSVLSRLLEPIVSPCRKLLSRFNTGMFDFSVFLAMILVQIVAQVLIRLIVIIL